MNMNHMNMNGLNVANGVGGSMPMMHNGTNGASSRTGSDHDRELDYQTKLNTNIYDYFLKQEQFDCARQLLKSSLNVQTSQKPSPSRRPNGVDESSMDADSKDDVDSKLPPDLPHPDTTNVGEGNSFLLEWFSLFWDMFFAARKDSKKTTPQAMQYMQQTQQTRMRQEQHQQFLRQPTMMNPGTLAYQNMLRMQQAGGIQMTNEMRQRASQNRFSLTPQQIMQRQTAIQLQMERGASDVDINGQRPRTPSSGDNAPSPSKRPRLEGPQFPGQPMMPNGRPAPQGMHPQQRMNMHGNNLLMQNGIHPSLLDPIQHESFLAQPPAVQQKSIEVYNNNMITDQRRRGMQQQQGMSNQESPLMPAGMDIPAEFYNSNNAMRMGQNGQQNGNHALQDYQMQLMLLEQQNKKRLLMARQEQDNLQPGRDGMAGQQGFAQGMSPQGSRSGPSPNPSEQIKRGTPKMGQNGVPGSPMPDGSMHPNRASPVPMNFGSMPPEMFQPGQMKMVDGMGAGPNGNGMRPPSSHPQSQYNVAQMNPQQMEAMRMQVQNSARMPNGNNWQQGPPGQPPMMPQVPQPQPTMGTPQPRAMPPPATAPTNGRATSPAQSTAAPPTPSQTNKAAPKSKKDKQEPRKRPTKKTSTTAATPSSEADNPPPTPTPSTPITPMHAKSFTDPKNGNGQMQGVNGQAPTSVPAPALIGQPQPDINSMTHFTDIDPALDLTFSGMDTGDVLEQFDFDSYLHDSEGHGIDFDPSSMTFPDFMEAGNIES